MERMRDKAKRLKNNIVRRMPKEVQKKCMSELKKLKNMSPMSAEATVVRNYLDWMIDIPWFKKDKVDIDLNKALKQLDEDHYGLEKVKERIIEFLAVQKRMDKIKGPILCLIGPPGVGKTSLGKSIAKATNRQFVRMSLGGVRDEAEIRGHRRTYIGSLPGRIIQMMKKAGTKNPLLKSINISNTSINTYTLDQPALSSSYPIKSNRRRIITLGGIIGLMGGVFLAFLLNFIQNQKNRSEEG